MSHDSRSGTDRGTPGDSVRGPGDSPYKGRPGVPVSQGSAPPPSQPDPGAAAQSNGCEVRWPGEESPTNLGASENAALGDGQTTGATRPMAHDAPRDARRRQTDTLHARQRNAAARDALGEPVDVIVETCRTTRSALRRWRQLPAYQDAVRHERATLARDSEALRIVLRAKALRVAEKALDAGTGDPALVRAVLAATTPDGAERDARARAAVLRRLPPKLRAQVALHLDDADAAAVEELDLEQTEAAIAALDARKDRR